jgi:hypothetical protein
LPDAVDEPELLEALEPGMSTSMSTQCPVAWPTGERCWADEQEVTFRKGRDLLIDKDMLAGIDHEELLGRRGKTQSNAASPSTPIRGMATTGVGERSEPPGQ